MSLRAVEHSFTGTTTAISSYDSTKTNLGSLMIQKSGLNPEDNFVGPFPVAVARPMEEPTPVAMMYPSVIQYSSTIDWVFMIENLATASVARRIFMYEYNKVYSTYSWKGYITANLFSAANANTTRGFRALRYLHTTGTVSVAAPVSVFATGTVTVTAAGVVTHSATGFLPSHVGLMIGFGAVNVNQINCWYPIVANPTTSTITIQGASSAYAAGTIFVIASCVVTGVGTGFTSELMAAGTSVINVLGGMGPRIGFGSTDPTQITQWFQIGRITNDTTINLINSPGVIPAGTPYVIEELRFALSVNQASVPANGGLFLVKGVGYGDFQTNTLGALVLPAIATNVDNQRGVYWLCDNGAGAVTNTASSGCYEEAEISKTSHFLYVLDGSGTTNAKFYKYNLRANNTVASGKMQVAGANIVVTGTQAVTGTFTANATNNLTIATTGHGPGSGNPYLYFVTPTRLLCAPTSAITAANTTFIASTSPRQEIPPGGITTFPATAGMMNARYLSSIDRLVITTYGSGAAFRNYVTKYPDGDQNYNAPFDHVFGIDDKQQDQSLADPRAPIHFNTASQILSLDALNGVVHICKGSTAATLNQLYALPFGAHQTYAYTTSPANHQRVITPSISTAGCIKFDQVLVVDDNYLGSSELELSPESYRIYYRTANIGSDSTSSWALVSNNDLSGVTAASAIQFMFEFFTIGSTCLPARIMKVVVTYEDGKTDSHYELSSGLSNTTAKTITWRFSKPFGTTVPTLKAELFNADTGASLTSDTTLTTINGTWSKSIDGGSNWISYDTDDKSNDITYIRYTSTSATTDNVMIKAVLTQN